jgi:hypothetical protein
MANLDIITTLNLPCSYIPLINKSQVLLKILRLYRLSHKT